MKKNKNNTGEVFQLPAINFRKCMMHVTQRKNIITKYSIDRTAAGDFLRYNYIQL